MIPRPPRSTLFPSRRSSDLGTEKFESGAAVLAKRCVRRIVGAASGAMHRPLCRSEEHTLNSSHPSISYAVFCLKKKNKHLNQTNIHTKRSIAIDTDKSL